MKIICDIDNVVVDWQMAWINKYEKEFTVRIPWATRGRWDCYSSGTHFTSYAEFSAWLGDEFWFDLNQNRIHGAGDALWRAAMLTKHEVTFATHRPKGAPEDAASQLAGFFATPVVFATPLEKGDLDGDVWIDDSPELLWDLKRRGKKGIRFVCPWNEGAPGIEMNCWSEFPAILKQLEEGQ